MISPTYLSCVTLAHSLTNPNYPPESASPELRNWLMAASFSEDFMGSSAEAAGRLPDELELPVITLRDSVLYPRAVTPLYVNRERAMRSIEAASELGFALVIAQKTDRTEEPKPSELFSVGTIAMLGRNLRLPSAASGVLAKGVIRAKVVEWLHATPYLSAKVQLIREPEKRTPRVEALMRADIALFEEVVGLDRRLPEDAHVYAMNIDDPGWLADLIAQTIVLPVAERQALLEIPEPGTRLQRLSKTLALQLDLLELEDEVYEKAEKELDKGQREVFLREQIKALQTELGEITTETNDADQLLARLKTKELPDVPRQRVEQEIARLSRMNSMMGPEIGMTRNYVEWLLDLPWTERTTDNLDVANAEKILNERHYGLKKAKERILEYISVRKLTSGRMRSPIICFVGPPGTGKTSLARSIAEALGRKFARMSVGGIHDEAEIRGHRRTYVGALPGRILQTLKRAGTVNPLFVLDEIDKMGDYRGDPAAALLEALDPEQNAEFEDHYLDIAYDLSQVLWVTTANSVHTLPSALLDRMEIIEFPGYVEEEKLEIARRYIIPRTIEENGLKDTPPVLSDDVVKTIVREYTYEAGVRGLEREISMVLRKLARRKAEGKALPRRIQATGLNEFLGPPQFDFGRVDAEDQVGVANGVSWSEGGGDLMQIEVTELEGKGSLQLTGQLGNVMQESAQAAMSYARGFAAQLGIAARVFEKSDFHVHVAEGAIPKDGPSAGIAIATALVSTLTRTPIRRDVAMTGEITLRGRVLPIGGLKEKILAAHRAGIHTFILPKKNAKDLDEVPRKAQRDMTLVQVTRMDEVLKVALTRAPVAPPEKPEAEQVPAALRPRRKPAPARPRPRVRATTR